MNIKDFFDIKRNSVNVSNFSPAEIEVILMLYYNISRDELMDLHPDYIGIMLYTIQQKNKMEIDISNN